MKGSKDADQPGHDSAAYVASVDERATAGKALRDKIPRHEHGRWKNSKGRANPVDLLRKSDTGRMKELLAIRYGRMLASPFAFYRGSAGIMASELCADALHGAQGASVWRLPPNEFWRICYARTQYHF
jgi:Uncharacterized protein conserved in bacteria (DUF2252)